MNRRNFLIAIPALAAVPFAMSKKVEPKLETKQQDVYVHLPPMADGQLISLVALRGKLYVMNG